jgi:two-component sensor histidine kinase
VLDRAGRPLCVSDPGIADPVLRSGEGWQLELAQGSDFVMSGIVRIGSPPVPIVMVAVPLGNGSGAPGILAGGLKATNFTALPRREELPETAIASIVDRYGVPLASSSLAAEAAITSAPLLLLLNEPGQPLIYDPGEGPRRLLVAEPVMGGRLSVVVGLPAPRWSWLERELVSGILAPTLMLLLAVIAIWIATELLINRHIRTLAAVARSYSGGWHGKVPELPNAPTELRALALTMARMAERIRTREDELQATIAQKDELLREVHHRVKNNLQIVTSLLNLRARSMRSEPARDALLEAQMRIKALGLVHRKLYERDDVKIVELSDFLSELLELLRETAEQGPAGSIGLEVLADPVRVSTDRAIPLALLVTEAVSNALRHAFPDGQSGHIAVHLQREGDRARLAILDDGIGLSAGQERGAESSGQKGIGLMLITMLAKQIGGSLQIEDEVGTSVLVEFAEEDPYRPAPVPGPALDNHPTAREPAREVSEPYRARPSGSRREPMATSTVSGT